MNRIPTAIPAQTGTMAVAAVLGGAALALGLAFGLGGRERAQRLIEESEKSWPRPPGAR